MFEAAAMFEAASMPGTWVALGPVAQGECGEIPMQGP